MDFTTNEKLCRTCLALTRNYESMEQTGIFNMLAECLSVQITRHGSLPHVICTACLKFINKIVAFKDKCVQSEETLQEYLKKSCDLRWLTDQLGKQIQPDAVSGEIDNDMKEEYDDDVSPEPNDEPNKQDIPDVVMETLAEKTDEKPKPAKRTKPKLRTSRLKMTSKKFVSQFRASVIDGMTCLTCKKTYNRKDKLKRHMVAHKFDFRHFSCPENGCAREFNRLRALSDHVKRLHKFKKTLKCDICYMDFYLIAQLEKHKLCNHRVTVDAVEEVRENGDSPKPTTPVDKPESLTANELDYVYGTTDSKRLTCPDCSVIVNGPRALKKHRLRHNEPQFRCPIQICNLKYYEAYRLTSHLKIKHQTVTVNTPCPHCTKKFYTNELLDEHVRKRHLEKIEALCDTCGMSYKNIHKHMTLHKKESLCHVCGKTYVLKSHMVRHVKREHPGIANEKAHENVQERTCKYCAKEFRTKKNRQTHESVVHRGKTILCQICNITIKRKSLSSHMIFKHDKGERYPCQICSQVCKTPRRFRNHMRVHTDERPYPCAYCDKSFRQVKTQLNHMRLHTGEKPHACKVCEKRYAQPNGLAAHMKTHAKYGVGVGKKDGVS